MRLPTSLRLLTLPLLSSAALFGIGLDDWPDDTVPSTFNGKTVPPPTYLDATTFDEFVRNGYSLIEFFSPYCHHCQAFAPTWKTLYEYYYTQEPVPQAPGSSGGEDDLNSFTRYYDFRFAKVDCVANADLCSLKEVHSFPTSRFYKGGEVLKEALGQKDLKFMSDGVEGILETIRPGSRPQGGPTLPKVGATSADAVAANAPIAAATMTHGSDSTRDKGMVVATRLPHRPMGPPNVLGKSTHLTAENFQRLVTMTPDPWFIKFYVPWCQHCQALAPNWQGMARQMQDRLNVGEVNCEEEKRLCKDVKVRGYPTILFLRAGERIEYDGLRGLGDLVNYANDAVSASEGVKDVTAVEFEEMEKNEEVIFLYFYDHATTGEDFAALDRLPIHLVGHAKLVKTNDPDLATRFKISTWPRLVVSREGKTKEYARLMPRDMRDNRRVLNWMRTVWLPIVPELTASNAREVMDGKLVVLAVLNRERPEEFWSAKREIKNAAFEWIDKQETTFRMELQDLRDAKQSRVKEAKDKNNERALRQATAIRINPDDIQQPRVGFAWVDGVFWERWIKTTFGISLSDGERVVVNDEKNKRYWDITMTGNPILPSRSSILETLRRIVADPPKISPKRTMTVLGHAWWVVKGQMGEHPVLSVGLLVVLLAAMGVYSRRAVLARTGEKGYGYFRVGEKGGPMDGLLGGNLQQGKKD